MANKGSGGSTAGSQPTTGLSELVAIREQLRSGKYRPQPVRRVEIPKPDGGVPSWAFPTVVDRIVQHAVMQVLQKQWTHVLR